MTGVRTLLAIVLAFSLVRCAPGHGGADPAVVTPLSLAGLDSALASDRGSVTMVHVWATWCAPCLEELPGLADVAREFSDSGFALILVSADDPEDADSLVVPALNKAGMGRRSYIFTGKNQDAFIRSLHPDWSGAMPASFLYDRSGRLSQWFYGERSRESYAAKIRSLIHE